MYDTIIAGGGINGLMTAALCANSGERVLLVEKSERLGGRCRVADRDGYMLDYGIHLIRSGRKSVFAGIFKTLGHSLDFREIGTSYYLDQSGRIVLFPSGPGGILKSRLFTFRDRFRLGRLLLALRSGRYPIDRDESLEELLDREDFGENSGAGKYLTLLGATLMVCPSSGFISAGAMLECITGILRARVPASYPEVGWGRIVEILERTIRSSGEIVMNTSVDGLLTEDGVVTGVRADDRDIEGKRVVLGLTAPECYDLLGPVNGVDAGFLESLKGIVPTAGITVDYALNGKVSSTSGLWLLSDPLSLGIFTSNLSPVVAPPDGQLYTHFRPLDARYPLDKKEVESYVETLEATLFKLFPGMKEAVRFRRVMHLDLVDGAVVSPDQAEGKRPGVAVQGIRNLFLVGDYVDAEGAGGDIGYNSVWDFASRYIDAGSEIT